MSAAPDLPSATSVAARAAVEAAIPHRDPFLFVDGVVDAGDDWIATRWRVPEDAEWFRGHYPGQPVLPGVLCCEHVFQSGALLVGRLLGDGAAPAGASAPVLTRIGGARFRRMVRPGETLETRVQLDQRTGPAFACTGHVTRGGERVLRVEFVVTSTGGLSALDV